jgi:hypothetical protein
MYILARAASLECTLAWNAIAAFIATVVAFVKDIVH